MILLKTHNRASYYSLLKESLTKKAIRYKYRKPIYDEYSKIAGEFDIYAQYIKQKRFVTKN
jgi:hypothetical protein